MSHSRYIDVVIPSFGERLRMAIEAKGITQTELGQRVGRNRKMISMYVNGARYPSFEAFYMICNVLNVSADWLMELEE